MFENYYHFISIGIYSYGNRAILRMRPIYEIEAICINTINHENNDFEEFKDHECISIPRSEKLVMSSVLYY